MRKNILLKIGWLCALPFIFSSLTFGQYVNPASQNYDSPGDYITRVSFNTINNVSTVSTSGSSALFGDYTSVSTTVNPSSTYELSISTFWSEYPGNKLYVYVFFDWNHDYDFVDTNESYIVANGVVNTNTGDHIYNLAAQNITIPSDASLSNIRMRVRMITAISDPTSAGMINFSGGAYGEIEDYTIVVSAPAVAPTISSISPTSGLTTGGTSVVITGANFTGATAVSFGGTAASSFAINSATQITATSPAKAAGTVDITVTTAGGTSAAGSSQFTYLTAGTFTGATNSDWNTANNWAGGSVPTSATDVTIPSGKTAVVSPTATATCNNLSITGNLTIQSSSSGTGSLIVTGAATGSVDCQRYMANGKWHLITPTASGQTVAAFLTANNNISTSGTSRGMMDYNTLGNNWNSYYPISGATGTMVAGKGYATRITADGTITYTGTLTTGTKTVALTTTGQGWNCVGNPYASAISMNTTAHATNNFITVNSSNLDPSYACIYIWDEDATYTGQSCYKVICNSGYSTSKTILAQNYVAPGQGFFVKANSSATNISFTSAMQSSQPGTVFRVPVSTDSWPGITLTATNASTKSSAVIAFDANMTNGLDPTYDAGLLRGTNGLSLYTRLLEDNGVDFAVQCLPADYNNLTIPVGIDSKTGGEITFSAETAGLPQTCKLILEDKGNGTFASLADGKSYTTTVVEGEAGVGRFYLHAGSDVSTEAAEISQESGSLKAYMGNGTIVVEGEVSGRAIATLYNLQGQTLRVNTLQKGLLNVLPDDGLPQGAYFITIQQYGQKVTCKLIKK